MVASGVTRARLPAGNDVVCTLRDPRVPALARRLGTTRSAAALELWRDRLDGAVVAIGNAPTALFHLLDMLDAGAPRPAAVLGIPVGFVGAAESKDALTRTDLEHLVVRGRRGGSAITAAALNALACEQEILRDRACEVTIQHSTNGRGSDERQRGGAVTEPARSPFNTAPTVAAPTSVSEEAP